MQLSFYTPIAYDYKYSYSTILSYYEIADEILLAIDKDRISWSGNKYDFDESFFDEIKKIDKNNKIKIIESNFHLLNSPIENDTQERNYITSFCKKGNYIIGIDSDEIVLNSNEFYEWFNKINPQVDISCSMSSVYKIVGRNILVNRPIETSQMGTNLINSYKKCRITKNLIIPSPLNILHFSWGRSRQEIIQKLTNFGHSKDFHIDNYMKIWDDVNLENYQTKRNLHPLKKCRNVWVSLELFDIETMNLDKQVYDRLITFKCFME